MHWVPAYIGLGSNLDGPGARVAEAGAALATLPACTAVVASPRYGSRPLGSVPQPDFCNAVAGLLTQLSVRDLFHELRALEARLGRAPPRLRWGPRRIDLDLLVIGATVLDDVDLRVPHRGLAERNFVLYPLADLAPDLLVPGFGRVRELLRGVTQEGLWLWPADE
jgi:2-amino-4-hydroxy-6-hydroxymethyldihydropteridine diphosphokinase